MAPRRKRKPSTKPKPSKKQERKPKEIKTISGLPMTARTLRTLGFDFLRYDSGCFSVCMERSPWSSRQLPDVLGLNKARHLIELEIKISKADFNHDMKKKHRQALARDVEVNGAMQRQPNYLYYLVPQHLVEHVLASAPEWCGILTPGTRVNPYNGFPELDVIRKAPRLHDRRLSIKHCVVFARDMAGTMASLLRDNVKDHAKLKDLDARLVALDPTYKSAVKKKKKPKK